MSGYCTTCGGSGYRRPARMNKCADLVARLAATMPYGPYETEDATEVLNGFIKEAVAITRKDKQ